MKLLIKQRVMAFTDKYDVYDECQNIKYNVSSKFLSFGHEMHVYEAASGREVGIIKEKVMSVLPCFEVYIGGRYIGKINKAFTFAKPKYEVDYNGWSVIGNIVGWNYRVIKPQGTVMTIDKEVFHFGDTYVINYDRSEDEIMGLLLVLAIDAVNCTKGK